MEKSLSVTEVRNNFSEIVDEIRYLGNTVVLIKNGKPAAVLIPVAMYEKLQQQQESSASQEREPSEKENTSGS